MLSPPASLDSQQAAPPPRAAHPSSRGAEVTPVKKIKIRKLSKLEATHKITPLTR
jgi:hypothetical protein